MILKSFRFLYIRGKEAKMTEKELKKQKLIDFAKSLIGTPYKRGAKPRAAEEFALLNGKKIQEADCSSFTAYVFWETMGVALPASTILQATESGQIISSLKEAEPGDLVFFHGEKGYYDFTKLPGKYIGHVAILNYNGGIIHAVNSGGKSGVVEHLFNKTEHPSYHPESVTLIKRFI